MEGEDLEPTIQNILDNKALKWIFVGGKGGVGKTTTSCCLATQLAKVRRSVLLISTDPAHNLSDAFDQRFSRDPQLVKGYDNLYAMEVDPDVGKGKEAASAAFTGTPLEGLQDMTLSFPGIDEAMSFAEVLKFVDSLEYEVFVFDTAPTGHTLRLLSFPDFFDTAMGKIMGLKDQFGPLFGQLSNMMNMGDVDVLGKMGELKEIVAKVSAQFKDPDLTTFCCVCIPEFLSVYETERLVQELDRVEMDCQNVIINNVIYPENDCAFCGSRSVMQQKYIEQIYELYEDFHIIKLPQLKHEIRGLDDLKAFSEYLVKPYEPPTTKK